MLFEEYQDRTGSICELAQGEVVAIDGKTVKGTKEKGLPNIVTAFAPGNGLSLGQAKTNDKSNEITAIPELLKLLALEGTMVAIDAIKSEKTESTDAHHNLDHGRIEARACWACPDQSHIEEKEKWTGLKTIARIQTRIINKASGKIGNGQRIYISSLGADAKALDTAIRKHWSVENNLHWILDVPFREDAPRKRKGNAAENFNIMLKVALGMIVKETTLKKSKKNKRMPAAYDYRYRENIMESS